MLLEVLMVMTILMVAPAMTRCMVMKGMILSLAVMAMTIFAAAGGGEMISMVPTILMAGMAMIH